MIGDPRQHQAPWVWGDLETAQRLAKEHNESMGINEERAMQIVASSMRAQNVGQP